VPGVAARFKEAPELPDGVIRYGDHLAIEIMSAGGCSQPAAPGLVASVFVAPECHAGAG
jgi:hypothetical protein